MNCRHCSTLLTFSFVDLGNAPPSNAYLTQCDLKKPELWYPLRVLVCTKCWLVQTEDYAAAGDIFTDNYAYFSTFSKTWLEHAARYVDLMIDRFQLSPASLVVELAANDGYLLQYVAQRNIPCIGVEPTASTADSARSKGITIIQEFFGKQLAREMLSQKQSADLIVANNVLAHVPDINDFVAAVAILLKGCGVATFEFPHLLNLVAKNQFDTIYHEHYSYLSLTAVNRIFNTCGLSIFDVEELSTHGGSLRVFAQRAGGSQPLCDAVNMLLEREEVVGISDVAYYRGFQGRVDTAKNNFLRFLLNAKQDKKKVAAYGAAAKGNTFLNYAGARLDLLPYVVDKSPVKQGKFLPGTHIPIVGEDLISSDRPDYIVILPWNIKDEIISDLNYVRDWGARFVTAIPELHIV